MNAPGPDQPRRGYCDHPRLHWHYPCDSCRAEERAELAKLRADIAYRQDEKEITLHIQDEYSDMLRRMARRCGKMRQGLLAFQGKAKEYRAEATRLRTALARAEATAVAAVEALEAQGAVVEALNRENARLCADLLAAEGQGMEAACQYCTSTPCHPNCPRGLGYVAGPVEAEVRVEWGAVNDDQGAPMYNPLPLGGPDLHPLPREWWQLVRRTVTTSPWVEVPAEDEGPDDAR